MLCLNWVNKENGDKQTWLRGYMNEVTICLSPCAPLSVSFTTAEMQQCGVTGLDLQQQTTPHTHFITPTPSPSALLTNHPWEPLDVTCCLHQIYSHASENGTYSCSTTAAKPDTDARTRKHTHSNNDAKFTMLIHTRKEHRDTNLSLSTPVLLKTLTPFLFWVKEGTCNHNHAKDDKKDTTHRGEKNSIVPIQSNL